MKAAVVGGGLAGCAAALELLDAGHDVTLLEARPTLGGAVQTLPEREGDPAPPPDNGQHIALGCFTEYLAFLERIGESGSVRRMRLSLPVVDEGRRWAQISPGSILLARYAHLPLRERPLVWQLLALRGLDPAVHDDETFADFLSRKGQSQRAIERFWDVFIRPALNLPSAEASAAMGIFTVQTALLAGRRAGELVLPAKPLGRMHGDAARRALERDGATVETGVRVDDARRSGRRRDRGCNAARRIGAAARRSGARSRAIADRQRASPVRPSASAHAARRATRLGRALGLRPRRAHRTDRRAGQYLTIVSSGVPELMEIRGRELVDHIASQLTERLGHAELALVACQPRAACNRRPASGNRLAPAGGAHVARRCHARGRVDRDRLARDDGERRSLRPYGSAAVVRCDN